jgi:hypothetical protein
VIFKGLAILKSKEVPKAIIFREQQYFYYPSITKTLLKNSKFLYIYNEFLMFIHDVKEVEIFHVLQKKNVYIDG